MSFLFPPNQRSDHITLFLDFFKVTYLFCGWEWSFPIELCDSDVSSVRDVIWEGRKFFSFGTFRFFMRVHLDFDLKNISYGVLVPVRNCLILCLIKPGYHHRTPVIKQLFNFYVLRSFLVDPGRRFYEMYGDHSVDPTGVHR